MNVLGPKEHERVWPRHVIDSAQLLPFISPKTSVLDVGSGSGFPAVVISLLARKEISVVESQKKKCDFLRYVSRETQCRLFVHHERVENHRKTYDVIVGRAVSSIEKFLQWTRFCRHKKTRYILLKGCTYKEELDKAFKTYNFVYRDLTSLTDPEGKLILIEKVRS